MPKYREYVNEVIYKAGWVEVEAATREAARDMVEEGEYDENNLEPRNREVMAIDVELIKNCETQE